MNKLSFLIFFLIFCQITASSQSCLPDGIIFTTQTQIDNFQTNYPNCTEIEGEVEINGDDITNLNGLSVLTSIGGYLRVYESASLTSLTGLENVTTIAGISIYGNYALTSLTALYSLTSIAGGILIDANATLAGLTGLDNVTSIGGDLEIWYNNELTSLMGLEGLTSIGGSLGIYETPALTSLTGLDNVTSIGGHLCIATNAALESLTGLDNVASIGGILWIGFNETLTSLTGLENIDTPSIGKLYIYNNPSLSICEAQSICDYLASPNGVIDIHDNASGCNSQEEVDEACGIVNVNELKTQNSKFKIQIHPNPFSTSTTIEYELIKHGTVRISFYNHFGMQVEVIEQSNPKGLNKVVWTPDNLPTGIYYFRLQSGEQLASGKTMLMR